MNGHFNEEIEGEIILWADATLEGFEAGYEEFILHIREEVGCAKLLRCLGYLGFQMIGFWDEVIIEAAYLHAGHQFTADCERRVKPLPESGSGTRVVSGNLLLEIVLIDGCRLWVCANRFRAEYA